MSRFGYLRRLVTLNVFWIAVALVIEFVVFAVVLPAGTFLSLFNIQSIVGDSAVILILAFAETLVIITGGIDLSVGSTLTLGAVLSGRVVNMLAPSSGLLAIIAGLAVALGAGALIGVLNGYLVAYHKLPSFVVTLGTLSIGLGSARLASGGVGVSGAPQVLTTLGQGYVLGLPIPFLVAVLVLVCLAFLLEKTRFGEYTYFIGSNADAATRAGLHVRRHLLLIYTMAGALAGGAGLVDFARFNVASISTGHSAELLASIAAVVIGGTSLLGGVGFIWGSAVGVFIPAVLANGLVIAGIERFWQDVIVGFILIAAVWFDQWRRSKR